MADQPNATPKTLDQIVAEKQAAVINTTLESLANTKVGALKKKADLNNQFKKQDAGQDKILTEVERINGALKDLSSTDLTLALNGLNNMVAAGGL